MTKLHPKYGKTCINAYKIRNNINLPPWCSGTLKSTKSINAERLLHDLNASKIKRHDRRKKVDISEQNVEKKKNRWKFALFFIIGLSVYHLVRYSLRQSSPNNKTTYKLVHCSEGPEECKAIQMQLTAALSRAEQELKRTRRHNNIWDRALKRDLGMAYDISLGEYATVTVGPGTNEWIGGQTKLWGLIPLGNTSPSPHTIVVTRKPTLGDCWPFIGSHGELVIEWETQAYLHEVGIEHVQPDTANSAPEKFSLHALFKNETTKEILNAKYTKNGTALQLYIVNMEYPVKRLIFKILSNHGNEKYTCIYRLHLFGYFE